MNTKHFGLAAVTAASVLALAACGGGGSDPAPAAPAGGGNVTPTALSLSGTAATGEAIAGGTVGVKCAAGAATPATTATSGAYTVSVSGGTLPCVLNVTRGSTVLHSLVAAAPASGAIVANITPLTELVVANVAGGSPATLFGTFDAAAQARVTPAAVATAISTTASALQGTVDLTGVNPLTDTLVAGTGSSAGNALAVIVETLVDAIDTSQTTLEDLTRIVGIRPPGTGGPGLGTIAQSTATCAALRSGIYRVINPHETTNDPSYAAYRLKFDAVALTLTDVEPSHQPAAPTLPDSVVIAPVADAPCRFTSEGEFGTTTLLVSPSGAFVGRSPTANQGPVRTFFFIPEQTLPLSELAGTWNSLAYERSGSNPLTPRNGRVVIDATGQATSGEDCLGLACTAYTPAEVANTKFAVNANGGFDFNYEPGIPDRAFAFKTAEGAIAAFLLGRTEGGIAVLTKQVELPLPAVGAVTNFWDFTVGSDAFRFAQTNGASALTDSTTTVTAVDAATKSVTRVRSSDQRVDTSVFNNPRDGLRYRAAATSPSTNGVVNVSETVTLPLAGTGLVFYSSVAANANFFGLSITKP